MVQLRRERWNDDILSVLDERGGRLQEDNRCFRPRPVHLPGVLRVVQTEAQDLADRKLEPRVVEADDLHVTDLASRAAKAMRPERR
jgi:hypothetical protein